MREIGGKSLFDGIFQAFGKNHFKHITEYGSSNEQRLTGKHETHSIDKFSWGISDRGASIRIPQSTANEWKGYLEDRRPGSNADPYKIIREIVNSLDTTHQIYEMKNMMNTYVDAKTLEGKYGTMTNDELLNEYREEEAE